MESSEKKIQHNSRDKLVKHMNFIRLGNHPMYIVIVNLRSVKVFRTLEALGKYLDISRHYAKKIFKNKNVRVAGSLILIKFSFANYIHFPKTKLNDRAAWKELTRNEKRGGNRKILKGWNPESYKK